MHGFCPQTASHNALCLTGYRPFHRQRTAWAGQAATHRRASEQALSAIETIIFSAAGDHTDVPAGGHKDQQVRRWWCPDPSPILPPREQFRDR